MKMITLYIPEVYLKALDDLVENGLYPNRAEAMRTAIRELIQEDSKMTPSLRAIHKKTQELFNQEPEPKK